MADSSIGTTARDASIVLSQNLNGAEVLAQDFRDNKFAAGNTGLPAAAETRPKNEDLAAFIKEIGIPDDNRVVARVLGVTANPNIGCDRARQSPFVTGSPVMDTCGIELSKVFPSVKSSVTQAMSRTWKLDESGKEEEALPVGTSFKLCDEDTNACFYVTNEHVAGHSNFVGLVAEDNKTISYQDVLARDHEHDLILVSVPEGDERTSVTIGSPPAPGDALFTVGHPYGYPHDVVTAGHMVGIGFAEVKDPETGGVLKFDNMIVSDVSVLMGNSGGPEFDKLGKTIGIKSIATSQGFSVSQPISSAVNLMKRYERDQGKS